MEDVHRFLPKRNEFLRMSCIHRREARAKTSICQTAMRCGRRTRDVRAGDPTALGGR